MLQGELGAVAGAQTHGAWSQVGCGLIHLWWERRPKKGGREERKEEKVIILAWQSEHNDMYTLQNITLFKNEFAVLKKTNHEVRNDKSHEERTKSWQNAWLGADGSERVT